METLNEPTTRGRPRRAETDERLLRAAAALLRERGPSGVTIEAVDARSGLARTTIYRRFDSRRELLEAVIDPVVDRPLPPLDLTLEGKVRWVLDQVGELLEEGLGRGTVAAILTDSDPEFTAALRAALTLRLDTLRTQIQTDVDAGNVAADVAPDAIIGLLLGALLGELLRHGTTGTGWADDTVALVTRAIEVRSGSGAAGA